MRRRFLKRINNEQKYLIIEPLEDGRIYFYPESGDFIDYYRIDGGSWRGIYLANPVIDVIKGQIIEIKGNRLSGQRVGQFEIKIPVKLSGNCLSLLFGDNASRQTDISMYQWCFTLLFASCKIVEVSDNFLPATSLSNNCYDSMFKNCSDLIKAPRLPATALAEYCYDSMFYGCTSLNYIKMLATDISARYCLNRWVYGVASTGTFVKNPEATWDVVGVNGVPQGWAVKFDGEEDGGLLEFTVDGVAYQFEDGMTWKEWCDSSYNIAGFIYDWAEVCDGVYTSDYKKYILQNIEETTVIEAGAYTTKKVAWPM